MSVSKIQALVRDGKITSAVGADLLHLRRELSRSRRWQRLTWFVLVGGLLLLVVIMERL